MKSDFILYTESFQIQVLIKFNQILYISCFVQVIFKFILKI